MYVINVRIYPTVDQGSKSTPIELTSSTLKVGSSLNMIKTISIKLGRQTVVDTAVITLAPLNTKKSWLEHINCGDYIEIEINGAILFFGLVSFVGHSTSAQGQNDFSINADDLGKVFTKYAKLPFSLPLSGWIYNKEVAVTEFIDKVTKRFSDANGATIINDKFKTAVWESFFNLYEQLTKLPYTFSDNKTIYDKFKDDGSDFYQISPESLYPIPLYVKPFESGDTTFFEMWKGFVQEPFNEIFLSTFNTEFQVPFGTKLEKMKGFKMVVRPSVFHPDFFTEKLAIEIPREYIANDFLSKSDKEVYTLFASSADMTTLGVNSAFTLGNHYRDDDLIRKYGVESMLIPIKSGYTGQSEGEKDKTKDLTSLLEDGGQKLQSMYGDLRNKYSGSVTMPYIPLNVGSLIKWKRFFGQAEENVMALVDMIEHTFDADVKKQPIKTTAQVIRGEKL